ncbi:hypothetical protein AVEN_215888-1 [Araneus ventricosus]|uniref:Uncharacterized protein n=1 Tax=Araneus ventricosus TaxID=182803 RepID=A0A4Y2HGN7_ARAVE|nr:hypothetical protein AVEN_215888-1 [Araneus ventricosus]
MLNGRVGTGPSFARPINARKAYVNQHHFHPSHRNRNLLRNAPFFRQPMMRILPTHAPHRNSCAPHPPSPAEERPFPPPDEGADASGVAWTSRAERSTHPPPPVSVALRSEGLRDEPDHR